MFLLIFHSRTNSFSAKSVDKAILMSSASLAHIEELPQLHSGRLLDAGIADN